jgi:hypothetical protein
MNTNIGNKKEKKGKLTQRNLRVNLLNCNFNLFFPSNILCILKRNIYLQKNGKTNINLVVTELIVCVEPKCYLRNNSENGSPSKPY